MVRFIVLWKNTPTDVSAFERHYREVHIPLAKKLAGLRRYTLSRNASVVRGEEPHYCLAELDWDDMASLRRAFESSRRAGRRRGRRQTGRTEPQPA